MRHHPSCWNKVLAKLGFRRVPRHKHRAAFGGRLSRIESLEARQMMTVTVNTLADVVDANDAYMSLREAIAHPTDHSVDFHPSLYGGTIRLASELAINQPITITGPGAEKLTIDAAGNGRVFHVSSSVSMATISGLKITGGAGVTTGGGILNEGGLRLDVVDVVGNQSTIFGGGVYSDGLSLEVVKSTIADNRSSWGGGVFSSLTGTEWMYIHESTISGNVADDPNSSNGQGGGIRAGASSPAGAVNVSIINTTISNNRAESQGGGVHFSSGTKADIRSTTITENRADVHSGGILNESDPVLMRNTILAGNTAGDVARADGSGSLSGHSGSTSRYNFVGIAHTSFQLSTAGANSNLVGTVAVPRNPKLSSLTNAGGRTKAHVPLPLSPVIDFGADGDTGGIPTDQRGSDRTIEDATTPNAAGNIADIGAVEADESIAVGDFNGDGREDELRYSPVLKSLLVAEKAATGAGWEVGAWGSVALATTPSPYGTGVIVGDFNGDGRDDVMVLDIADNTWLLGISDGTQFHVAEVMNNGSPFIAGWGRAYVGDFDGDGDEEMLGQFGGQTPWAIVDYHAATGMTKATTVVPNFTPGSQVFIQDANRDGRDDLITRANSSSPWMVSLSLGASSGTPQFAAAADWNAWIGYGYDSATGTLDAEKAMAKVIEEFAWVYNNVELELYPGLMKGPEATRQTKAGNNWDQAALLEEKLQALGVGDVKIASGKVRVTADQFGNLANWLGVKTASAALAALKSLDFNAIALDVNGGNAVTTGLLAVAIEFTHAWVQAYVPTSTGLAWINLDPSWKFKDRQNGVPLQSNLELDNIHTTLGTGIFDEYSYLALNPTNDRRLPIEFFEDQVLDWLSKSTTYQVNSLAEVAYDGPIRAKSFTTLPTEFMDGMTLAVNPGVATYNDFASIASHATLKNELTHRVRIRLLNGTTEHWYQDLVVPEYSLDTIHVTFASSLADVSDPNKIAAAGSATLFGRLVVDGTLKQAAQSGESFTASGTATIEILHFAPTRLTDATSLLPSDAAYVGPSENDQRVRFSEKPGDIVSIGLEANQYSSESLTALQASLLAAVAGDTTESQLLQDVDLLGSYAIAKYWYDYQRQNDAIAGLMGATSTQSWVGSGRIKAKPNLLEDPTGPAGDVFIDYLAFGMAPDGFGIDLPNTNNDALSIENGAFHSEAWQLMGYNSSALEHNIVEEVTSAESVSTIKGLQRAYQQNLGVGPAVSGNPTPSASGDVIRVFESRVSNNVRTVHHVYNVRTGGDGVEVVPSSGTALSESAFKGLLASHAAATGVDDQLWDLLSGVNGKIAITDGDVTSMATRHRTDVDNWTGAVYIVDVPNRSMQFAIQPDGGGATNGGYSGGVTTPPPPELKPGNFVNATWAGDPVHVANGNMFRDETDIVFPNIGVPLTFSRHYDSQSKDDVGMGVGWTYSFSDMLYLDEKGTTGTSDDEVVWIAASGARHRFKKLTDGTYTTPSELKGKLTRLATNEFATGGYKYVFLDPSGMEYHFQEINDAHPNNGFNGPHASIGRLRIQQDEQGNGVRIDYINPTQFHGFTEIYDLQNSARRLVYTYGTAGRVTTITKYDGASAPQTWTYGYVDVDMTGVVDSEKRLASVMPPAVSVVNASYQESTTSTTTTYDYYNAAAGDPAYAKGLLKKITEADGSWHVYEYYRNGRAFRVKQGEAGMAENSANVDVQTFNYNLVRNLTEFTDERGNVETYIHQSNGLLTKQIHSDRSHTKTTWGNPGSFSEFLMMSTTDERGAIESFLYYDSDGPSDGFKQGQLRESFEKHYPNQAGLQIRYDYIQPNANKIHLVAPSTVVIDPNSVDFSSDYYVGQKLTTTSHYYASGDALGRLWKTTDAQGNIVEYSYYPNSDSVVYRRGLLKSIKQPAIVDAAGNPIQYETLFNYDAAGNVISTTTQTVATTPVVVAQETFAYDSLGNVVQRIVGANVVAERVVTESVYDALGRLRETGFADANAAIDPIDGFTSRFKYDKSGRVRESTDPLGRVTRFEYDRQGNVVKQINPDGTSLLHEYDPFGNCIAKTDALGRITRFVYDGRNRLVQTIRPDGAVERVRYDGADNVVASIDALGNVTTFKYDAVGRLLETKLPDPDGPLNDDGGTNLTEPTTTNKYDKLGNLIETIDPEANVTQFKYDKLGRVVQTQTLKGVNGNRNVATPWAVTGTLQSLTTTDYDAVGNVIETAAYDVSQYDATATATLLADPRAQQTPTNVTANKVQIASLRYDAFGRLLKTINADNTTTSTTYDAVGRVRFQYDEANSVTEFRYDAFGRLNKTLLPDPSTGGITAASPTTTYQYDAVGNRIATTDALGFTTQFEYDAFNRLIAATDPLGGRTRSLYDVAGQMVASVDALGRAAYAKFDDRGRTVLQLSADPDGAGPQLAPAVRSRYDAAGRLVEQIDPRGYSTTYVYDRLGRVTKEQSIISEVVDDLNAASSSQFFVDGSSTRTWSLDPKAIGGDSTTLNGTNHAGQVSATWVFPSLPAGEYRVALSWSTPGTVAAATVGLALNNFASPPVPAKYYAGISQTALPNDYYRDHAGAVTAWEETKFGADVHYKIESGQTGSNLLVSLIAPPGSVLKVDAVRIERIVEKQFVYDANGNLTSSIDELSHVTSYEFDELDRLTTTTLPDPDGASTLLPSPRTTRTYDGYGNLVKSVERHAVSGVGSATDDVATVYKYDARNRRIEEIIDAGTDGTINYFNQKTVFVYNAVGNLEYKREYAQNATTPSTFDLLRTTSYQYDKLGRLSFQINNSDGSLLTISDDERMVVHSYDAAGHLVQTLENLLNDPRQIASLYAYDALGRLSIQTEQGIVGGATVKRTTRFQYDAVGNQTAVTDALGRTSRSAYDRLDRLVKSTAPDPDGAGPLAPEATTYAYDAAGHLVAETNGANETERFAYDAPGQLVWSADGRGDETTRRYDAAGNLVRLVDAAQNLTTYAYDDLDRLTTETTSSGVRTSEYNAQGQLALATDRNGRTTEYGYDRLGRKGFERWYVDRATANPPNATDFTDLLQWYYDELGRLKEDRFIHYVSPGAQEYRVTRSYLYDGLDRLTETSNQSLYNNLQFRSLTAPSQPTPAVRQTYAYAYDSSGLIETREQFLADQFAAQTKSTYNAFGELAMLQDWDANAQASSAILDFEGHDAVFSYLGDGSLSKIERYTDDNSPPGYMNRTQTSYAYDGAGRLKGISHAQSKRNPIVWPADTPLVAFAYGYDAAGRINSIGTDWNTALTGLTTRTDETQSFEYDAAGQLIGVTSNLSGQGAGYDYGPNGNRTNTAEPGGGSDAYTTGAENRVSQDSTYNYSYDLEGNLTRRTSTADATDYETYAWDHRNRLTKVERYVDAALAETVAYRYDASDDLVYRNSTLTGQEHYVVESGQRTIAFEQDGDAKRRYGYGPTGEVLFDQVFDAIGTPTLQAEQDLLLPLGDHQHSTRVVLAHDFQDATYVRQSIDYAQFGRVTATLGANGLADSTGVVTAYAHHGSLLDAATGLQRKGERWYSPDLGRFVSEDPIQDGANWFLFAGNDPVNYADPSGLSMQGHPLAGGYSGNVTRQPTIKHGFLPGAASNNFLSTAVNSIGNAVGRGLGALAGALTPSRATPIAKPLSINDFSLSKDPGSLSRVHRPEALPPAPILNRVMEGYFNAYARNENFQRAVDGIHEQKKSLHLINRGTPLEAFSAQLDVSLSHAAGGLLPGVGEYQDVEMLVGRDSTKGQRALAAGSLALSLITLGESPNAGAVRRSTGVIDTHTVQELLDAQRYTHQIDVLPNSQVLSQIDVFAEMHAPRFNSAGQPINARGQFVSGAGGDSVAAQAGRNAHANFNALVDAKPDWTSQPRLRDVNGRLHIPDAISPSGRAVELKPDTSSGIKAGQRQINRYNSVTGQGGRVLYYDPVTGNIRFPFSE